MKVLIACEESQTVCKAFRALGHESYSCDVQEPSGGHPEWHILGGALEAVKDLARERKGWEAKEFFLALLRCGVERIAVENPTPLRHFGLPRYDQIIEPYMFGDPWRKRTCLWLRGLPPLRPTNTVEPKGLWVGSTSRRREASRKVQSKYVLKSNRDSKIRAKTFQGIAAAMAEQWGGEQHR